MYTISIHKSDYSEYEFISNDGKTLKFTNPEMIKGFFHNDKINYTKENNKVELVSRSKIVDNIAGELELYSKYSFKPNKKGVPTYLFTPINKFLPKFLVSSTIKRKKKCNQLITIIYTTWDKSNVFPKGNIIKIYGDKNDLKAIEEIYVSKYNLDNTNLNKYFKGIHTQIIDNNLPIVNRETITTEIISIDPDKCKNIDDAFSITLINKILTVDIHISDVYYLLKNFNLIDKINNISSIYLSSKINPMLPTIISNNLGSLLEKTDRFMISIIIKYDTENHMIISKKLRKTYGHIKRNYTYDNYPKKINRYFSYIESLYSLIIGQNICINDSHVFIEALMIIYNTLFCRELLSLNVDPIYRVQSCKNKNKNTINNIDYKLKNFINIIESHSALYSISKDGHCTLNINEYTHATSPLRRIIDLINQELYYNYKSNILNRIKLEFINNYNKNLKKCYRDIAKLKLAHYVYNNSSYITKCYLYDYNLTKKYIYLYFPDENISIKTLLYGKKIDTIYSLQIDNDNINVIDSMSKIIFNIPILKLTSVRIFGKIDIYNPDSSILLDFK